MNHTLLSSKDNALVSKTMTWRNNYAKGTWDPTIVGRSKRVLAGPEGSNASNRQERQDTSRPSVTDTTTPYMVTEIQIMTERIDFMMNALEG